MRLIQLVFLNVRSDSVHRWSKARAHRHVQVQRRQMGGGWDEEGRGHVDVCLSEAEAR